MTVEADRLTPILQCTRHLEWFFLHKDKQEKHLIFVVMVSAVTIGQGGGTAPCPDHPNATAHEVTNALDRVDHKENPPPDKLRERRAASWCQFGDYHDAPCPPVSLGTGTSRNNPRAKVQQSLTASVTISCLQRQLGPVQHQRAGAFPELLEKRKRPHSLLEAKPNNNNKKNHHRPGVG